MPLFLKLLPKNFNLLQISIILFQCFKKKKNGLALQLIVNELLSRQLFLRFNTCQRKLPLNKQRLLQHDRQIAHDLLVKVFFLETVFMIWNKYLTIFR